MTLSLVPPVPPEKQAYCAFCGKSEDEVERMIAGPTVFICNECVELCGGIIAVPKDESERRAAMLKAHLERVSELKRELRSMIEVAQGPSSGDSTFISERNTKIAKAAATLSEPLTT